MNLANKIRFGILLVCFSVGQGLQAQTKLIDYGPYIVNSAWFSIRPLIFALDRGNSSAHDFSEKELLYILQPMKFVYNEADTAKVVGFRPGNDPVFDVPPGQRRPTAVTNRERKSPILFNLGIINNPDSFKFSQAVGLIVHELGHKIDKYPTLPNGDRWEISQYDIDTVAGKVQRLLAPSEGAVTIGERQLMYANYYIFPPANSGIFYEFPPIGVIYPGGKIPPIENLVFSGITRQNEKSKVILTNHLIESLHIETLDKNIFRFSVLTRNAKIDNGVMNSEYNWTMTDTKLILDFTAPGAEIESSKVFDGLRFTLEPKLTVSIDKAEAQKGNLQLLGYVDFSQWKPKGVADSETLSIVVEENMIRKEYPVEILAGEFPNERQLKSATFSFQKKYSQKRKIKFIALRARNSFSNSQDFFYIPLRKQLEVMVGGQ